MDEDYETYSGEELREFLESFKHGMPETTEAISAVIDGRHKAAYLAMCMIQEGFAVQAQPGIGKQDGAWLVATPKHIPGAEKALMRHAEGAQRAGPFIEGIARAADAAIRDANKKKED